ncbi:hypothetical protein Droror1_Dr00020049 [Drosera rotundifolia]
MLRLQSPHSSSSRNTQDLSNSINITPKPQNTSNSVQEVIILNSTNAKLKNLYFNSKPQPKSITTSPKALKLTPMFLRIYSTIAIEPSALELLSQAEIHSTSQTAAHQDPATTSKDISTTQQFSNELKCTACTLV